MKLTDSAPFLLIATGTLLGLILPLGKIAAQAGIPPAIWTFLFSASAGIILFAVLLLQGKKIGFSGGRLRYYICTALISYAVPNLLILSAIPRLGAGLPASCTRCRRSSRSFCLWGSGCGVPMRWGSAVSLPGLSVQ